MEDRRAKPRGGRAVPGPSSPVRGCLRLVRPGIAVVLGAGALAVCVSVIRPVPAASQRATKLPVALLSVPATQPSTTSATITPIPTTAATTPRLTTPATSATSTYRPRTTYTTRTSPTTSYSRSTASTGTTTTTAPAPTTTTTLAPLGGGIPAPPSTLPLTTKKQSGHVNPVFAELSGVGFFIALLIVAIQAVLTRRGGKGRGL